MTTPEDYRDLYLGIINREINSPEELRGMGLYVSGSDDKDPSFEALFVWLARNVIEIRAEVERIKEGV